MKLTLVSWMETRSVSLLEVVKEEVGIYAVRDAVGIVRVIIGFGMTEVSVWRHVGFEDARSILRPRYSVMLAGYYKF
jgi:hypothetical protein